VDREAGRSGRRELGANLGSFAAAQSTTIRGVKLCNRFLAAGTLAALCTAPAAAWRPETQEAIALEAARLAPPDLARQIERHSRSFLAGVRAPLTESEAARHMKNADGSGLLDKTIAAEIAAAVAAIEKHRPFAEIVQRLGRVSHFVADANLPLNAANADREEGRYFRDYLDYAESARTRFAVVFYGVGTEWRGARDIETWTQRTLARGRRLYPAIGEEYRRVGMSPGTAAFDDRSTAFAVAALSYSHAVSDATRAFRYIWLASGGGDPRIELARDPERLVVIAPGGRR
jgi:hypothetical protein